MEELNTRIREGMDVEDADGDSIGTVDKVYQPVSAPSTTANWTEPATAYLKVKTGLFGLGGHWYIPASAVRDLTGNRIILRDDKSHLSEKGWDERPAWIKD
jgi:hypothetical protein